MYNSEALYYSENDLSFAETDDTDLFDDESVLGLSEAELFGDEETFDDLEAFDDETILAEEDVFVEEALFDDEEIPGGEDYLDNDIPLAKLAGEINRETRSMSEAETMDYMEDRMAEFLPALAAAIPMIIKLAPKAISAVSSLIKKDPAKAKQGPAPSGSATDINPAAQSAPAPDVQSGADISSTPALRVLTDLIQSPKLLELLSSLLGGKTKTIKANTGQQINASSILGVISSLAGALAGATGKESSGSRFPEYAMSNEGAFLIDPHEAIGEAELILDLIK